MAAIQPFVNLQPFKGTDKENLNEFLRQLTSCIHIAGINDADRHQYLHLHLKGGALSFFDQLPEATRNDYDLALAALRERYFNDQRIQLQKILFSARKMKPSEESAQDFLTDLQRLALEAYPNVVARAAAAGRPAVAAENRQLERNRRVREAFINGMPIKLKRFLMTQPDDTTIEDLCTKAASRMIVDKLYPEDDDSAFNEVSSLSNKDLLTGIQALSQAQDYLKQETNKLSEDLKDLNKNLQPTLNQIAQGTQNIQPNRQNDQRNRQNNNQNNRNFNQRGQNFRYPKPNNNQQNWRNNNQRNNFRNPTNWQPRFNNQYRQNNQAQSSRKFCNICNKFNHIPSQCWFRPYNRGPPMLPYSNFVPRPQMSMPVMTHPLPQMNQQSEYQHQMTQPWSPHYDVNYNPNSKN